MHTYILEREQWLPKSLDDVLRSFPAPRICKSSRRPELVFLMVDAAQVSGSWFRLFDTVYAGHGLPIRWTTEIGEWSPPHRFVDREVRGPYALWKHEHWFWATKAERRWAIG